MRPRAPWRWVTARSWPAPLAAVGLSRRDLPGLVIGCGGMGGAVGAALRRLGRRVVQIQNPRMPIDRFDLVVVNRHDEITGPNVIVTRTALHRVTPERLAEARRGLGGPRSRICPGRSSRCWWAARTGDSGSTVRWRSGSRRSSAEMMRRDRVGLAITPSRRTDPAVMSVLREKLAPLGRLSVGRHGREPVFRPARPRRRDRRHDGQRVDDLRGGGDRGAGAGCRPARAVAPDRPVRAGPGAGGAHPRASPAGSRPGPRRRSTTRRKRRPRCVAAWASEGRFDAADPDLRRPPGRQRHLQGARPSARRRGDRPACRAARAPPGRSPCSTRRASPSRSTRCIPKCRRPLPCSCRTCARSGRPRLGMEARPITDLAQAGGEDGAGRRLRCRAHRRAHPASAAAGRHRRDARRGQRAGRAARQSRRYLDKLNFATNFAFFREQGGLSTRLVTANYWSGYGAKSVRLWLRLFDADGAVLATWEEDGAAAARRASRSTAARCARASVCRSSPASSSCTRSARRGTT